MGAVCQYKAGTCAPPTYTMILGPGPNQGRPNGSRSQTEVETVACTIPDDHISTTTAYLHRATVAGENRGRNARSEFVVTATPKYTLTTRVLTIFDDFHSSYST
jgi:hypothetical protein